MGKFNLFWKTKSFSNVTVKYFLWKVVVSYILDLSKSCMYSENLVAEIHLKFLNNIGLITRELCTCKYATFREVHLDYIGT